MDNQLTTESNFSFFEAGKDNEEVLMLLHGLFGALSNFQGIIKHFSKDYNVVVPMLPIFELPMNEVSVMSLVEHVEKFVEHKKYEKLHVLGNSLGGHIAQLFALNNPEKIESITLTGSSGLFESAMGSTYPQRGNYEYIRDKTRATFYDPDVATQELIDEVHGIISDRNKAIRIVKTAKSAVRHNLGDKLHNIKAPTLLVWGKQDTVTPPMVGEKFHELIQNSRLEMVDKCGHAPMMELPDQFNAILEDFLLGVKHNRLSFSYKDNN